MGLFSKKKEELDDPAPASAHDTSRDTPLPATAPASSAAPAAAASATAYVAPAFGVAQAAALIKSMPPTAGSPKAYMGVVKKTLEAVGVSVEQIIADGERRSAAVMAQIAALQEEVHALESAAAGKKSRVAELQSELEEIASVQERFREASGALGFASSAAAVGSGELGLLKTKPANG